MALLTLRYEGAPNSGRTTAALSHLHSFGLRVPSDPEAGREDVSILDLNALLGGTAGAEMNPQAYAGLDDAKDSIARAMMEITGGLKAKACIIENARDVYTIAGEDAKAVLEYIRFAAEGEGLRYLILEGVEPPQSDETARAVFDSLDWLRGSPAKTMLAATPQALGQTLPQVGWEVSRRIAFPFTLSQQVCAVAGFRLGPACELTEIACKIRLAKIAEDKRLSAAVNVEDVNAALRQALAVHHPEHVAMMRGKLARSQYSAPLAAAIAQFAADGGVLPTSAAVKTALMAELKKSGAGDGTEPSNGALWKTAKALAEDGVLWVCADGKAVLRDSLLGVRLLRPELHQEVDKAVREQRVAKIVKTAARNI